MRRTHFRTDALLPRAAARGLELLPCLVSRSDAVRRRRCPITTRPLRPAQRPLICSKLSREKNIAGPCDWKGGRRGQTWAAAAAPAAAAETRTVTPCQAAQLLVNFPQTMEVWFTRQSCETSSTLKCAEIKSGALDGDRSRHLYPTVTLLSTRGHC